MFHQEKDKSRKKEKEKEKRPLLFLHSVSFIVCLFATFFQRNKKKEHAVVVMVVGGRREEGREKVRCVVALCVSAEKPK